MFSSSGMSQTVPRSSTTPRSSSAPMAAARCRGDSSEVTYSVAWTRINMAPRVIATMRMVVRTEARIIFMGLRLGRPEAAWRRIAQPEGKQNAEDGRPAGEQSAQAGPIVGHEDGIAGIGGVVLDAGRLARNEPFQANLAFESGDVLRSVIGDAGNQITIGNEMARAHVRKRAGACAEQTLARLFRCGRVLDELDDLPFGNAADLVQMEAALAFLFFGIQGGTQESISDHGQRGYQRATHGEQQFPIGKQGLQRADSVFSDRWNCTRRTEDSIHAMRRKDSLHPPMPTDVYSIETSRRTRNYACGAYTGLRNTPTPATLTSTVSPATSGPTPAGVPVAMTSPGIKVIMREIQRTRNAGG